MIPVPLSPNDSRDSLLVVFVLPLIPKCHVVVRIQMYGISKLPTDAKGFAITGRCMLVCATADVDTDLLTEENRS